MSSTLTEKHTMRPGSEDYKKIPSLHNGQRIPYRIPAAICPSNKTVPVGFAK